MLEQGLALDDGSDDALRATLRKAIRQALRGGEISSLLDCLAAFAERGRAEQVLWAARGLLDGLLGSSQTEAIEQVAALHLQACRLAPPDPMVLAAELLRRERELDAFAGADHRYAAQLGAMGREEFRRLAEIAWRHVQPSTPDRRAADDADPARARLAALMERIAGNDIDARIAVRSKTLTSLADYQAIVALCRRHGRKAEAKHWAEEAAWSFPSRRENARPPARAARGRR